MRSSRISYHRRRSDTRSPARDDSHTHAGTDSPSGSDMNSSFSDQVRDKRGIPRTTISRMSPGSNVNVIPRAPRGGEHRLAVQGHQHNELVEQLTTVREENKSLQNENKQLYEDYMATQSMLAKAEAELKERDEMLEELETIKTVLVDRVNEVTNDSNIQEEEITAVEESREREITEETIREHQSELEAQKRAYEELEAENAALRNYLKGALDDRSTADGFGSGRGQDSSGLSREISTLHSLLKQKDMEIEKMKSVINDFKREVEIKDEKLEEYLKEVTTFKHESEDYVMKASVLENEKAQLEQNFKRIEKVLRDELSKLKQEKVKQDEQYRHELDYFRHIKDQEMKVELDKLRNTHELQIFELKQNFMRERQKISVDNYRDTNQLSTIDEESLIRRVADLENLCEELRGVNKLLEIENRCAIQQIVKNETAKTKSDPTPERVRKGREGSPERERISSNSPSRDERRIKPLQPTSSSNLNRSRSYERLMKDADTGRFSRGSPTTMKPERERDTYSQENRHMSSFEEDSLAKTKKFNSRERSNPEELNMTTSLTPVSYLKKMGQSRQEYYGRREISDFSPDREQEYRRKVDDAEAGDAPTKFRVEDRYVVDPEPSAGASLNKSFAEFSSGLGPRAKKVSVNLLDEYNANLMKMFKDNQSDIYPTKNIFTNPQNPQELDLAVIDLIGKYAQRSIHLPLIRQGDYTYSLGSKKLNLRLSGGTLMVRQGGGYQDLVGYLNKTNFSR